MGPKHTWRLAAMWLPLNLLLVKSLGGMASESLPRYSWKSYSSSPQQLYLTSTASVDQAIDNLNLHGPFGLDIEWKPNFRRGEQENPVALIQIANNDTTLLIHVSAMSGPSQSGAPFVRRVRVLISLIFIRYPRQACRVPCQPSHRQGRRWNPR